VLAATAAAASIIAGAGIASPAAAAATPVIDSFVQKTAHSVSKTGTMYIYLKRLRTVPAEAGVRVSLLPPKAARSTAPIDSWAISGPAGNETLFAALPRKMGVYRLAITLHAASLNEERSELVFNAPDPFTTTTAVTPGLVVANIVAQHVPGISLMFFPQVKLVKAAGAFLEGWSLYADLQQSLSGALIGCPSLAVGQVIQSTSTAKQSGEYVQVWVTTKIWSSQRNQSAGLAPVCTLTNKLTEYN